jgi:hypothetical protein
MTSDEYRDALARLGLSQVKAAHLFGSDPRTSRRWALGERDIPICVEIVLRLMLAGKITVADIEAVRL